MIKIFMAAALGVGLAMSAPASAQMQQTRTHTETRTTRQTPPRVVRQTVIHSKTTTRARRGRHQVCENRWRNHRRVRVCSWR